MKNRKRASKTTVWTGMIGLRFPMRVRSKATAAKRLVAVLETIPLSARTVVYTGMAQGNLVRNIPAGF